MLYFTDEHMYVRLEGAIASIGYSDYKIANLGKVVEFKSRDVGDFVSEGSHVVWLQLDDGILSVASPVAGEVYEKNNILYKNPQLITSSPEGEGWLIKLRLVKWPKDGKFLSRHDYLKRIPS